ncbi:MAG: cell division protein SepF [Actinomycetaceae bacterium]|nr:cell division protein SepF [Actinomycetaceae bacterium]
MQSMGMFQRFVDRATLNDEYDYEDGYDDYVDEDDYDADVAPIHSISSVPQLARIVTVHPTSFSEVRAFAVQYRSGLPVILNLADADDDTRKRIVDFALGLCFGLEGQLNKVSDEVLLMTPHTVTMDEQAAEDSSTF